MDNDPDRFVTKRGEMKHFDTIEEARAWRQQQLVRVQEPSATTPTAAKKSKKKPH